LTATKIATAGSSQSHPAKARRADAGDHACGHPDVGHQVLPVPFGREGAVHSAGARENPGHDKIHGRRRDGKARA
jgi:hypothetical protein